MTSTRLTKDQLTEAILGNEDTTALKAVLARRVETILDENAPQLDNIRSLFEVRTTVDGEVVLPDGPIIKLIRSNIDKCVHEGLISSVKEGSDFLAEYASLINNELLKIASNPVGYVASDKDKEASAKLIVTAKPWTNSSNSSDDHSTGGCKTYFQP